MRDLTPHVRLIHLCLINCLVLVFMNCRGPAGPLLTGQLSGFIRLYNEFGGQLQQHDGVTVSIENLNVSVTTDSTGRWVIDDVKTGTYTILYSKPGYGPVKTIGFQFLEGEVFVGIFTMSALPSYSITSIAVTESITHFFGGLFFDITVSPSPPPGKSFGFRIFFHQSDIVSSDIDEHMFWSGVNISSSPTSPSASFSYDSLISRGLQRGSFYVRVYPINNSHNASQYLDPSTGRTVYNNLGDPYDVIMLTVPLDW